MIELLLPTSFCGTLRTFRAGRVSAGGWVSGATFLSRASEKSVFSLHRSIQRRERRGRKGFREAPGSLPRTHVLSKRITEAFSRILDVLRVSGPPVVPKNCLASVLNLNDSQQQARLGNPLTIYKGLSGTPGPKPRKGLKKVSRTPESLEKVSNKSLKSLERVSKRSRKDFSRLFPACLFSDFFGVSGPDSPRDRCIWSIMGSQSKTGGLATLAKDVA